MGTDVNQTNCGDHFTMSTNINSLCCNETNVSIIPQQTNKHRMF